MYTTVQAWAPVGLRGVCSGRSKSRYMARNRGEGFRAATAKQAHVNHELSFFFSFFTTLLPVIFFSQEPQAALKG